MYSISCEAHITPQQLNTHISGENYPFRFNLIMHGLSSILVSVKNQPGSTSTLLKNQNTTDFASNASAVSTLPY